MLITHRQTSPDQAPIRIAASNGADTHMGGGRTAEAAGDRMASAAHASATAFRLARPTSKSLPTMRSMFIKRQMTFAT